LYAGRVLFVSNTALWKQKISRLKQIIQSKPFSICVQDAIKNRTYNSQLTKGKKK